MWWWHDDIKFIVQSAVDIYLGHFSSYNSKDTPYFPCNGSWVQIWLKFYHCNCWYFKSLWYLSTINKGIWLYFMGISSMFISNTNQQIKMITDYFCTKRRFHEMEDFNSTNEIGLYSMYNGTSHIIINVWSLKLLFSVTLMIISNIFNYTTAIAPDKICINTILAPGLKAHKLFIGALCPYQGHTLQSMANNTGTSDRKCPIIQEQELPSKRRCLNPLLGNWLI